MPKIFLSYSSEDRERVRPLVDALEKDGFSVWWDREIKPGPSFDREIEKAIDEATCVVVVWSASSVESEWVRSEVEEGARRNILVPLLIDNVLPPLAYRRRQSADLSTWKGSDDDEYQKLLAGIDATIKGTQPQYSKDSGSERLKRKNRFRIDSLVLPPLAILVSLLVGSGLTVFLSSFIADPSLEARRKVIRFEVPLPDDLVVSSTSNPLVITPDGQRIIFNGKLGQKTQRLYVRDLGELEARTVPGVERSNNLLGSHWISPDGEWIIFNDASDDYYKKVNDSGSIVSVVETGLTQGGIRGLSWGPNGDIVFANRSNPGLMKIPGGAGSSQVLTVPAEGLTHEHPEHVPTRNAVIYTQIEAGLAGGQPGNPVIRVLDMETGEDRPVLAGRQPVVTTSGHLLYVRDNSVWASRFDLDRLEAHGESIPVLEGLLGDGVYVRGFDVAANGTLGYVVDTTADQDSELVWVDLDDGGVERISFPLDAPLYPRLSPTDDRVVAMDSDGFREAELWVHAFERQVTTRLTFKNTLQIQPEWSPDGERIIYSADQKAIGFFDLFVRPADGTPNGQRLTENVGAYNATVLPDGSAYLFLICSWQTPCDIAKMNADGEKGPEVILTTEDWVMTPAVSPNGNWVAYTVRPEDASSTEVFVSPFPDMSQNRWQISTNKGELPMWSRTEDKLYYAEPDTSSLMSVDITFEPEFSAGRPVSVFDMSDYVWRTEAGSRNYDINLEGDKLLMVRVLNSNSRINVVVNWFEELERLLPKGSR